MKLKQKSAAEIFNADVKNNAGYLFTTNARLSSVLANQRLTDASLTAIEIKEKRVLDIGCGDGEYSVQLYDRGKPSYLAGVDVAAEAIKIADSKKGARNMEFFAQNGNRLPFPDNSFDFATLRGLLHHVESPVEILQEAFRVSPILLVIEPNGWNPLLKLIEKLSDYHIQHREQSFSSKKLDGWISGLGGKVQSHSWLGLVPFFCPDWMARGLKFIEPTIEKTPILNILCTAVYVFVARKDKTVSIS